MRKLDLKYRPKNFEEVIGQEITCTILKKSLIENQLSSAYLIFGSHGSGKTTLSRILAMSILCKARLPDGNPCGKCASCESILLKQNLNYREEDGGSKGTIEQIREILNDSKYKALDGAEKKIVVFDEAHGISKAGQNALLKELEEGNSTIYIFCTTEHEKVLPTVISRCFLLEVRKAPIDGILKRLEQICQLEKIPYEQEALKILIKARKSHLRDCLKEVDKLAALGTINKELLEEYLHLDAQNTYFEVLYDLDRMPDKAIKKVENLLTKLNPSEIYNGLITAALDCYRQSLGLDPEFSVIDSTILRELWAKHTLNLLKIVEYLQNRKSFRVDRLLLLSDLVLLSQKLKNQFATEVVQKIVEVQSVNKVETIKNNNEVLPNKPDSLVKSEITSSSPVSLFTEPPKEDQDLKYMDDFKSPFYKQGTSKTFYDPNARAKQTNTPKKKVTGKPKSRFDVLSSEEFTRELLGGLNFDET